ncbi:peroxiredoxin family protein [Psychroflexus planctonicus]|uniref:Thioredoxin domain-containing protein n=1 Tax=Psychroflexus planctonicus TaxID=1526575 RepID=A0ABQ1SJZ8_9FLAO|nr:TlpA disulfide reductase family protein [Psychroflexus planctonicus]GGE43770.1 hypothetical protein GCM10010832_24710 [Psychroflexus planctonicus]
MKDILSPFVILLLVLVSVEAFSQYQITGNFPETKNQKIQLLGFEGIQVYLIDETQINQSGDFKLDYNEEDYGMGYLNISEKENHILVLAKENISLEGKRLSEKETIILTEGNENILFSNYAKELPINQNALGAWEYLMETYRSNPHLKSREKTIKSIASEITYLNQTDSEFMANLPEESYIKWFIPVRNMVSDVSYVAQQQPELIPQRLQAFRNLQHDNDLFYKSGLYKDAFEGHFWLIENSGLNLNEANAEMKKSIDVIVENLAFDDKKMNETGEFLFQFLESRNLFEASEYLAVKLLNESSCTLNSSLEKQLEIYRKMKPGNTAENIVFEGDVFKAGKSVVTASLKEIQSDYYLIAFGSSWCPACVEELPKLQKEYASFQQKGVEIVMISLDTSKQQFQNFIKDFDFYAASDYKKWKTQAISDYHVFSTPTLYLIDKNRKIVLRPNSVEQAKNWIQKNL